MISGAHIYPFRTLGDDLFDDRGGSGKQVTCPLRFNLALILFRKGFLDVQ